MIFVTKYNPSTLQTLSASTDSGFASLAQVMELMGEPDAQGGRWIAYDGLAYSDFPFRLEEDVDVRD